MSISDSKQPILVFDATGQQGGSVATALLKAGWPVRALVRNPASPKSAALRDAGVALVQGTFADADVIRAAMKGVHGVFSVQPSSGQGPELGLSDEDEERFGTAIADLAVESGVEHLVYSSVDAVTGRDLGALLTEAAGRPITYARFSDEVLTANPFLGKLTALLDEGPLAGHADLKAMRTMNPEMQSFRSWLAGSGHKAFEQALGAAGAWEIRQRMTI